MPNVIREQSVIEAIQKELDIDAQLIVNGLQELQSLYIENGEYFQASQSLSQGLERMMKVVLFLSEKLDAGDLKVKYGHNLEKLWKRVRELHEYKQNKDKTLNKELKTLSEFNEHARYYYLNILDRVDNDFDPQKEWEKLEERYFRNDPAYYTKLSNGDEAKMVIEQINRCHIIPIEKIVTFLSRVIVARQISEVGWNVPIAFQEFARYDVNKLGETDYTAWPQCLEHKDMPYKITWRDIFHAFFLRLIGCRRDKSKVIYKKNFKGIWPYREIKKVRVIKRYSKKQVFHLILIDGYLCALDGKTAATLHLPTPHKADYAVVGYSTQPFLDLAMGL